MYPDPSPQKTGMKKKFRDLSQKPMNLHERLNAPPPSPPEKKTPPPNKVPMKNEQLKNEPIKEPKNNAPIEKEHNLLNDILNNDIESQAPEVLLES